MTDANVDSAPAEARWDAAVELVLERQNGLNWCWAAVAKGIVEHYDGPIKKQCQYATTFLGLKKTCCRVGPLRTRCDAPRDVDGVLQHFGMYAAPPYRRPVSLDMLRRELERDRPVIALINFPSSVHALVITAVDLTNRRLRISDPAFEPRCASIDLATFSRAYRENGRWFYTVLTKPPAQSAPRPRISLLRDRFPHQEPEPVSIPFPIGGPLEIDLYEADPYRLADGTGLQTAERFARKTIRLDVGESDDASRWLERELAPMRVEIEPRVERGFEPRIVRCFAYKLEALWFADPRDPSHRHDHYIAVPPVPYYLEAGREYTHAELRDALIEISPVCLRAIEENQRWIDRLDRETVYQRDES
ncbi:MAG TPA: papain-like cysteine protease family protein [Candidatus Elarobacter sp.]